MAKNPNLLIEILVEEIPARLQMSLAQDIGAKLAQFLHTAHGQYFATPRRLAFIFDDIAKQTAPQTLEIKGPRLNAPAQALEGFCKSNQCAISDLSVIKDEANPKNDFYLLQKIMAPQDISAILPIKLAEILEKIALPKSMKYNHGNFRFIRPIRGILIHFNDEYLLGDIILGGAPLALSATTFGHRLYGNAPINDLNAGNYGDKMRENFVIVKSLEREAMISQGLKKIADDNGCELIQDDDLLQEAVGLVEYPVVYMGEFDEKFLNLPEECLIAPMRGHQKYFSMRQNGKITNKFAFVSNAPKGDKALIIHNNQRVLRARLNDAQFLYDEDIKLGLDYFAEKLKEREFFKGLGTLWDKQERVRQLCVDLNQDNMLINSGKLVSPTTEYLYLDFPYIKYLKADLTTNMVSEFPELQGVMGKYYVVLHNSSSEYMKEALTEHYLPNSIDSKIPNPKNPWALFAAIADKLDTINEFFKIGEKPTSSKDPFALRRAAIGIIRICFEGEFQFNLTKFCTDEVRQFIKERIAPMMTDPKYPNPIRPDVIRAVLNKSDDLYDIKLRADALQSVLNQHWFFSFHQSAKRAQNILIKNAKYQPNSNNLVAEYCTLPAEKTLLDALNQAISKEFKNYSDQMAILSEIAPAINNFFDEVMIEDENPVIRLNRLNLLQEFINLCHEIADFSQLEIT